MSSQIRRMLVSIHDVTPALAQPVRELWAMCRAHAIVPALLVVPNWHGEWPLEFYDEFTSWVRGCANDGAEIFLHGERHDEVGSPRDYRGTLRAVGRTNREGEFLMLDAHSARSRIERGLARLHHVELAPIGFIPPAWLARAATHDVVRDVGLAVSEDISRVVLHRSGTSIDAPAIRWSGRTIVRANVSARVNAWRWTTLASADLVRLALHPQDLANAVTRASVERELARWASARHAVRYGSLS